MKKEELIRKLENAALPDLLVVSHKERLKVLLLEKPATRKATGGSPVRQVVWNLTAIFNWLRAPAWRAAAASAMALFVIGAAVAVIFYVSTPSPSAIAANIVKNDPGIQQKLGGTGEIIIVRVEVRNSIASVVCGRSVGDFIEADVDINGRAVVSTRRYDAVFIPELPVEARDSAIKVALLDPTVKEMVAQGGLIGRVVPIFSSISKITMVNGNILEVTPAASQAVVPILYNGKSWLIEVNLEENRIEHIIQPQSSLSPYLEIHYTDIIL
ncbi:MAG: hypothetical protein ABSF74_01120 [Dehalococcoidia bacterium]|jgi:hypothetical protein